MAKTKSVGTLTLYKIRKLGGFLNSYNSKYLIDRILMTLKKGQIPEAEDLNALALALKPLCQFALWEYEEFGYGKQEAFAEFSRRAGLTKKQGRQKKEMHPVEMIDPAVPIVGYLMELEELTQQGMTVTQAKKPARELAIKVLHQRTGKNIGDRAMRDRIARYMQDEPAGFKKVVDELKNSLENQSPTSK